MKKNIILSVVCGMVAMASLTSCNDFLQVSATNQKKWTNPLLLTTSCVWQQLIFI